MEKTGNHYENYEDINKSKKRISKAIGYPPLFGGNVKQINYANSLRLKKIRTVTELATQHGFLDTDVTNPNDKMLIIKFCKTKRFYKYWIDKDANFILREFEEYIKASNK